MADSKVDMGSCATHEGEESPKVFFVHGEKITVMSVFKMWVEEGTRRFFSIQGSDGFIHTLYREIPTGNWFYRGFEKNKAAKR